MTRNVSSTPLAYCSYPHTRIALVMEENADQSTLKVYSTYDLPSVESLVRYFHAAAGFPVRATWINAIKMGNYRTWPSLTLANATTSCPSADESINGHMIELR